MTGFRNDLKQIRSYLLLWFTQLVLGLGSNAAFLFAVLWMMGIGVCLLFRCDQHIRKLEE